MLVKVLNLLVTLFLGSESAQQQLDQPYNESIGISSNGSANIEQFSYQAGIVFRYTSSVQWCDGALVSSKYILTSAFCAQGAYFALVILGTSKRYATEDCGRQIDVMDRKYIKAHEKYNHTTGKHNIALVKLPIDIEFTASIRPISLPPYDISYVGERVIVSGWKTIGPSRAKIGSLRQMKLKVVDNVECHSKRLSTICLSNDPNINSTCIEDNGSPIVDFTYTRPYLIGISSYRNGRKCASGKPRSFIRVSAYITWIFKTIGVL